MKKKINNRAQVSTGLVIFGVVLLIAAIGGSFWMGMKGTGQILQEATEVTVARGATLLQMTVAVDPDPRATSEQDSDGDIDIDIFEVVSAAGLTKLATDKIIDCSETIPKVWDGKSALIEITDPAMCKMNTKRWAQDTGYNAGDSESEITRATSGITLVKADVQDTDHNASSTVTLYAGRQYLFTVLESATTDQEDCIAYSFLFTMNTTTVLTDEQQTATTLIIQSKYWSDAITAGKIKYDGDCKVGDDTSSLTSTLADAIPTNFGVDSAETDINFDCDIYAIISAEGYAIILENPLPKTDTDKGYVKAVQFGERLNSSTTGAWTRLLLSDSDKIMYNTAPTSAGNYSLFSSIVGGVEILSTSDSDADKNHNEKLFQDDVNFMENVYGKDKKITIPVEMNDVSKVNDSATAAAINTINADGGSEVIGAAQYMLNLTVISPLSTNDLITQIIKG